MLRRQLVILPLAVVLCSSLVTAVQTRPPDLTGTWSGTFVIAEPPDEDPAHFVLKQSGTGLTGTGGPTAERQRPIAKGKVTTTKEGTTATFDVAAEDTVMHFELALVDGRLKGTARAERDGRKMTAAVDVGREK